MVRTPPVVHSTSRMRFRDLMFGLQPKSPARNKWVSLTSALTWTMFDHAFELPALLEFAFSQGWSHDEVRHRLTAEWADLADYASDGAVTVRGRLRYGERDIELSPDDLRNFRYVEWEAAD